MKSLIIVRHAKSSWENITDDFNRPLNERGKNDAPEMAKRLSREKIKIDTFISSPAKRAKKTALLFIHEFQHSIDDLILIPELYNASVSVFYNVAAGLDPTHNMVAIFAHNPGVTEFANSLTNFKIDDMPTCGIFAIKIHSETWKDFETAHKEYWFFNYPKLKS
jgi:phosphohistidine phosphatase